MENFNFMPLSLTYPQDDQLGCSAIEKLIQWNFVKIGYIKFLRFVKIVTVENGNVSIAYLVMYWTLYYKYSLLKKYLVNYHPFQFWIISVNLFYTPF